jgi:hypothetical protein
VLRPRFEANSIVFVFLFFLFVLMEISLDGLGDAGLQDAESRHVESEHAALAMIRLCKQYAGEVTLVCLGPLTSVALACKLDPTFPASVRQMIVMGGTTRAKGNVSLTSEFNFHKGETRYEEPNEDEGGLEEAALTVPHSCFTQIRRQLTLCSPLFRKATW